MNGLGAPQLLDRMFFSLQKLVLGGFLAFVILNLIVSEIMYKRTLFVLTFYSLSTMNTVIIQGVTEGLSYELALPLIL